MNTERDTQVQEAVAALENRLVAFASELVQIESRTGKEAAIAAKIQAEMEALGYDRVFTDRLGNVIGVLGSGERRLLFDSHMDHVAVEDAANWTDDPYGGVIKDGKLYGRGSTDMKAAVAASIYAGHVMKQQGLLTGKTVYVCCSVMEEDFDGEGLYHAIEDNRLNPDYVVICEPSQLKIALGHLGRAIYKIQVNGISAHGAAPEKGDNAVYKAAAIIERIEQLGKSYMALPGERPSIALTRIESEAASLNAIPASCTLYIDRRITLTETEESVGRELDQLVAGTGATWEIYDAVGESYTGEQVVLRSYLPAWEIDRNHPLTVGCVQAYEAAMNVAPVLYKWDFCTNGVASTKLGIPTVGFGPGIEKLAHTTDEYCPVADITAACKFYALLAFYL